MRLRDASGRVGGWTNLIDEIYSGNWTNPLTGKRFPETGYRNIEISESLEGKERDLVEGIGFSSPYVVVSDRQTREALGARVCEDLRRGGEVTEVVLESPHADMATVREIAPLISASKGVVAVGSGTVNDLAKFASFKNGQPYCVFATAGSMNGYTSSTASITLDSGLKVSLPAQVPQGMFVDLSVCAAAPAWLNAAGFGDCLCRSVAQVDWWMSHRVLGTTFRFEPFLIEIPDEIALMERARGIATGEVEAVGHLFRVLTLCGLGINVVGTSHHGSMGEHQISHYIDCFAGARHPGSSHGQQVGVASLTMARLQRRMLESESPPEVAPTQIDREGMRRRMGEAAAEQCEAEYRAKALDAEAARSFNARLKEAWPELREECLEFSVDSDEMKRRLEEAGGPSTAGGLGIPADFYCEAVRHAHEMRNRFSFADIACDSGLLDDFALEESRRGDSDIALSR